LLPNQLTVETVIKRRERVGDHFHLRGRCIRQSLPSELSRFRLLRPQKQCALIL
jgi:hypothetical protein